MSKVICDICGTSYPDTSEQCPICGYSREMGEEIMAEEAVETEIIEAPVRAPVKGGRFSSANVKKRNKSKSHYELRPVDEDDYDPREYNYSEDEKSNTVLVVLLILVIAAILVTTGYLVVRYILPNTVWSQEDIGATTEATEMTDSTEETTEPTIPCTSLVLTSGVDIDMNEVGQNWLLNVFVLPEDTTDQLVYTSSNESVATVNSEGRVTAVGEGEATITIICGSEQLQCSVVCSFTPETEATEDTQATDATENAEGTDGTEATEGADATESTEASEATEATEPLLNIKLWLNYTDLTLTSRGDTVQLKFNKELKADQIKWSSDNPEVATVENGLITCTGKGTTKIYAEYGDQKVTCIVRCPY